MSPSQDIEYMSVTTDATDHDSKGADGVDTIEHRPGATSGAQEQASRSILERSWVLESLAAITSAGVLIAIVALLHRFDGARQPDWRRISLNTLVAWLSTAAKACIALLISNSLGQLKWTWFRGRRRSLADLRTFDAASRGPFGSVQLLWILRSRHLASIGCFAWLLSIAFDPFLQNLIHIRPQLVPLRHYQEPASLSQSSVYNLTGPEIWQNETYVHPVLKANVYSALLDNSPQQSWAIPQYSCASGNCSWDPFLTLSAHYVCTNISSLIELGGDSEASGYPALPSGLSGSYLNNPENPYFHSWCSFKMSSNWSSSYTGPHDQPYLGANQSLLHVQYIAAIGAQNEGGTGFGSVVDYKTRWRAMDCRIFTCIQKVSAKVSGSDYYETYHSASGVPLNSSTPLECFDPLNGLYSSNETQGVQFGMSYDAHRSINTFFEALFTGSVSGVSDDGADEQLTIAASQGWEDGTPAAAASDVIQSIYYGNLSGCAIGQDPLECAINNTARALTKSFRDASYIQAGNYAAANMAEGTNYGEQPYVSIDWYWLILPVAVWLVAVLLWLATALESWRSKVPLWRNDPLPILHLFRTRPNNDRGYAEEPYGSRNDKAKHTRVQLHCEGGKIYLD